MWSLIILYIIMSLALALLCCSVGRSSVVGILETLEYLEKSFRQNLAAFFWMASILFLVIGVWGSQTGDVYSTIRRFNHTFVTIALNTTWAVT